MRLLLLLFFLSLKKNRVKAFSIFYCTRIYAWDVSFFLFLDDTASLFLSVLLLLPYHCVCVCLTCTVLHNCSLQYTCVLCVATCENRIDREISCGSHCVSRPLLHELHRSFPFWGAGGRVQYRTHTFTYWYPTATTAATVVVVMAIIISLNIVSRVFF